ncbi:hypothetical protein VPHK566_0269 [Vibrio phage K566]
MCLNNISTETLKAEIARREREEKLNNEFVPMSPMTDFERKIVQSAKEDMQTLILGDEVDTQYTYEAVMKAVYGDNVFDKINKLIRD